MDMRAPLFPASLIFTFTFYLSTYFFVQIHYYLLLFIIIQGVALAREKLAGSIDGVGQF